MSPHPRPSASTVPASLHVGPCGTGPRSETNSVPLMLLRHRCTMSVSTLSSTQHTCIEQQSLQARIRCRPSQQSSASRNCKRPLHFSDGSARIQQPRAVLAHSFQAPSKLANLACGVWSRSNFFFFSLMPAAVTSWMEIRDALESSGYCVLHPVCTKSTTPGEHRLETRFQSEC